MNFRSFLLILVLGLAAGTGLEAQQTPTPSPVCSDLLKLAAAGVGDEVLLSFVQAAKGPVQVSADDVIALKNAKVGTTVIQALLAKAPQQIGTTTSTTSSTSSINPDPQVTPPVLYESVPLAPGPGYQWYPGHWYWNGGWVWSPGMWSPGYYYYPRVYYWHRW